MSTTALSVNLNRPLTVHQPVWGGMETPCPPGSVRVSVHSKSNLAELSAENKITGVAGIEKY